MIRDCLAFKFDWGALKIENILAQSVTFNLRLETVGTPPNWKANSGLWDMLRRNYRKQFVAAETAEQQQRLGV